MKAIIIIVFALFSLSKSEDAFLKEFLQNANKIPQTTSYSKYVKNVASTINAISDIVESSKLSILPSLGVPKSVVDNFSDAEFSIGRVSTPREEYSINLKSGALTMGLGIASMKKEHIRFSYVEVKVTGYYLNYGDIKMQCAYKRGPGGGRPKKKKEGEANGNE